MKVGIDIYGSAERLARHLEDGDPSAWALRLREAVTTGVTSTEILIRLRWTLAQLRESDGLATALQSEIDDLHEATDHLLSGAAEIDAPTTRSVARTNMNRESQHESDQQRMTSDELQSRVASAYAFVQQHLSFVTADPAFTLSTSQLDDGRAPFVELAMTSPALTLLVRAGRDEQTDQAPGGVDLAVRITSADRAYGIGIVARALDIDGRRYQTDPEGVAREVVAGVRKALASSTPAELEQRVEQAQQDLVAEYRASRPSR